MLRRAKEMAGANRFAGAVRMAAIVAAVALAAQRIAATAAPVQSASDIDALVARIGERVAQYYRRAQMVMCVERSTVQPIRPNWSLDGLARTVESDLRVELRSIGEDFTEEPDVVREIRKINGRAPRPSDAKSRNACTDPNPLSPEPLAFLLPRHKEEYRFTSVKNAREDDRDALVIAFQTVARTGRVHLIEDPGGHDDCFDWKGPISRSGRVWVDAVTNDVLKVETNLTGPVDIGVPDRLRRRYNFSSYITLERDDLTMHYRSVPFTDPDESMLLPRTIESLTVLRSDLQSVRRTDIFSDYRRFLTSGHIKKLGF
jgi:hypothetical protein